jgi:hypothetical protein
MNKLLLTFVLSLCLFLPSMAQERRDSVIIIRRYSKDTLIINADTLLMGSIGRTRMTTDTMKRGTMTIITRVVVASWEKKSRKGSKN